MLVSTMPANRLQVTHGVHRSPLVVKGPVPRRSEQGIRRARCVPGLHRRPHPHGQPAVGSVSKYSEDVQDEIDDLVLLATTTPQQRPRIPVTRHMSEVTNVNEFLVLPELIRGLTEFLES